MRVEREGGGGKAWLQTYVGGGGDGGGGGVCGVGGGGGVDVVVAAAAAAWRQVGEDMLGAVDAAVGGLASDRTVRGAAPVA